MTDHNFFLWPKSHYQKDMRFLLRRPSTREVETKLHSLFPNGYPVLVSSGRAGIRLVLSKLGLGRPDLVGLFPYASHCVIDVVGRVATPVPVMLNVKTNVSLVYHQWGYVQERKSERIIVEDAVDTLCQPGGDLFPAGGDFEVWSLPKILGTLGGGVIWCKDAEEAEELKSFRDLSGSSGWLIRALGVRWSIFHGYWSGIEGGRGNLTPIGISEVMSAISLWQSHVEDRKVKLDLLRSFIPHWLEQANGRLPCVIPVAVTEQVQLKLRELGVVTGLRHMERIHVDGKRELVKLYPLPIHQDVPLLIVERMAEVLS
ncbi:MAG: putative PLP-dependent aminotransferase [Halopseudomonas aestusnigri]